MSEATRVYQYLRAAGLDDDLRREGLVPERPGESDFDGKTPKGKTMDHDQGMSMHEHGTRFVDDAGRCLACCLNVKDAAIAQLSRDLDAATRERDEAIMLASRIQVRHDNLSNRHWTCNGCGGSWNCENVGERGTFVAAVPCPFCRLSAALAENARLAAALGRVARQTRDGVWVVAGDTVYVAGKPCKFEVSEDLDVAVEIGDGYLSASDCYSTREAAAAASSPPQAAGGQKA